MKNKFALSLLASALCLLAIGCQTTSETQQLATATKMAAYIGTSEYLLAHPEARPKFEAAERELFALESAETIDAITILAIAQRLPVKELKSERAAIYVTAATVLLSDYGATIPVDQINELKPIVRAMREGVALGLGGTTN
jgi:hypothetical protein